MASNCLSEISFAAVTVQVQSRKPKIKNNDLNQQHTVRQMKAELTQDKVFKHAEDEFIEALIYHRMWSSGACWKTTGAITERLKKLKYKKDKLGALRDDIQIRYLGLGWDECKTQ